MSVALVVGHALVGLGTGTIAASTILATARGWREDTWLRRVGRVALALTGPPTRPVRRAARRLLESRAETCDRLGHDRTVWDGVWTRCRRCQANGEPVAGSYELTCGCHTCVKPSPLRLEVRVEVDDATMVKITHRWRDTLRAELDRRQRGLLRGNLCKLERPWIVRYLGQSDDDNDDDVYDVTTVSDQRRRWYRDDHWL